jgi:hypothetical protein
MTLKVVELRPKAPCEDIVATLRVIADDIEAGRHDAGSWPATTAILILGHASERPDGPDVTLAKYHWHTHGFGPRNDIFTCRGLLATVIGQGFDSDD